LLGDRNCEESAETEPNEQAGRPVTPQVLHEELTAAAQEGDQQSAADQQVCQDQDITGGLQLSGEYSGDAEAGDGKHDDPSA
jgi:hypothetical protein